MPEQNECAHKGCSCHIDSGSAIQAGTGRYCSQRCADGRGCDHADCNCGAFPEAEPRESTAKAASEH